MSLPQLGAVGGLCPQVDTTGMGRGHGVAGLGPRHPRKRVGAPLPRTRPCKETALKATMKLPWEPCV